MFDENHHKEADGKRSAANSDLAPTSVGTRPAERLDLDRLAQLVANGQVDLPLALSRPELAQLVDEVRERRRRSLLKYVARCIATDIERSAHR